jgi:hypothetical protein
MAKPENVKLYVPTGQNPAPVDPIAPYIIFDEFGIVRKLNDGTVEATFENLPKNEPEEKIIFKKEIFTYSNSNIFTTAYDITYVLSLSVESESIFTHEVKYTVSSSDNKQIMVDYSLSAGDIVYLSYVNGSASLHGGGSSEPGPPGPAGPAGAKGTSFYEWNSATNVTNISQIAGMNIGDSIVNTYTANVTILGQTAIPGRIVRATSATAGTLGGLLQGPQGPAGANGAPGTNGNDGEPGPKGDTGAIGARYTTTYSYSGITTNLIRDGNTVMWTMHGSAGTVSGTPTIPSGYRPVYMASQFSGQVQGSNYRIVNVATTGVITTNNALSGQVDMSMVWITTEPYPV